MASVDLAELAQRIGRGDKGAVALALNLVEDRRPTAREDAATLLAMLQGGARSAASHRIGITGPPGVGKSTLSAALARGFRGAGKTVAILAIDPSSTRSGGALLGDRARMAFDPGDDGLFVRSVATGGDVGGLAHSAAAIVRIFAAAYDVVVVETTGVGQNETDVVDVVDTVVLVVQPGAGDGLQFIKAGVMEIPDVCVVNKSDESALAQRALADLKAALHTLHGAGVEHEVRVCATSALTGDGVSELQALLDERRSNLSNEKLRSHRTHADARWALAMFTRAHGEHGLAALGGTEQLSEDAVQRLEAGTSPIQIADLWSARLLRQLKA